MNEMTETQEKNEDVETDSLDIQLIKETDVPEMPPAPPIHWRREGCIKDDIGLKPPKLHKWNEKPPVQVVGLRGFAMVYTMVIVFLLGTGLGLVIGQQTTFAVLTFTAAIVWGLIGVLVLLCQQNQKLKEKMWMK